MIGLAVGIDYALFILSRHRNQLARGEDPEESAAMAVGTAGSAVVFAGVTVIIALLGLLVVGIPFLSVMGVGAAFAVLIAIGIAITLLPALMGLAKGRLAPKVGSRAWKRAQDVGSEATETSPASPSGEVATTTAATPAAPPKARSMGQRWVRGVMKRPVHAGCCCPAGYPRYSRPEPRPERARRRFGANRLDPARGLRPHHGGVWAGL
jgi:RND superfamily putative drug exporter